MASRMRALIEQVMATVCPPLTEPLHVELRMSVERPVDYDRRALEQRLALVIPESLAELWSAASSVALFEDVTYGQWGLILWDPQAALTGTLERTTRAEDRRPGDLLLGEFLGDTDKLLVRCDPSASDHGCVTVEPGLDRRKDWKTVGASLEDFLERYLDARGDKFWERELTHPL